VAGYAISDPSRSYFAEALGVSTPVPAPLPILGIGPFLSYTRKLRRLSNLVRTKDQLP
jgi:hypothetical protein